MALTRSTRAGFDVLQLENTQGTARVEVCPARGALVTRYQVGDDDLLFLDEATFADPTKNVRGGVPILFPVAGPAPAGSPMKQHGFARTSPWHLADTSGAHVLLTLNSSAQTRALFDGDFEMQFTLGFQGDALELNWSVRNTGRAAFGLHFGLHPYFRVPLATKAKARVDTDATRAYDNRDRALKAYDSAVGVSFEPAEVDLHLLNHSAPHTTLHRGDGVDVRLDWSGAFQTLVVWSLPGQPFVCVEPWSGPSLAAYSGPRPSLRPNETANFALRVSRQPH